MANNINDDAELIPDHSEAWSLAYVRYGVSNMARAYVELRELARKAGDFTLDGPETKRLHDIVHANDI